MPILVLGYNGSKRDAKARAHQTQQSQMPTYHYCVQAAFFFPLPLKVDQAVARGQAYAVNPEIHILKSTRIDRQQKNKNH